MLSKSGIASDRYRMFHVWTGPLNGGLAIGTVVLMAAVSAMNGLSVAGMAIGTSVALPEMLKRGYDKRMVTGVIQAGSSLGIIVPPSLVLVLCGMIARQPQLGPPLPIEERQMDRSERFKLLAAGILPLIIIFSVTGLFVWIILAALCFGAVFDDTAMLVIVAPLYIPLVISLGFNPIWYGVLYTVTCQIAYMAPPFGNNLFLMTAMAAKEITLVDIHGSSSPFVIIMLIGFRLVMLFPQIALWLPETYYAS